MYLTLAIPSLNREPANLPELDLPAFNNMLGFGTYTPEPITTSEFYGYFLWRGSLLEQAKSALNIPTQKAAIFVSPVWQQMGMHQMDMLAGNHIQITLYEAQTLCCGLNTFFQEDGWHFYPLRADLWIATLPSAPCWQVQPVLDVLGKLDGSIRAEGSDSLNWLQKQTEIQMWLHTHPINTKRTAKHMPAINGVWLWRDLCGSQTHSPLLGSNSPWAQYYPNTRVETPDGFDAWEQTVRQHHHPNSDSLLFLDDLTASAHTDDVWAYKNILENWEQHWFAPIWQAVQTRRLSGVHIVTDGEQGGTLTVKRKPAWIFWKRKKIFAGQLGK